MIGREYIIQFLKKFAQEKDYVYAMWLEGADGMNRVDEYSDIDFWFDVDEGKMIFFLEECVKKLNDLGKIDSRVDYIRKDIAQSNIHLANTSEYLTLDICIQNHNRDRKFSCYIKNDIAELPLVLFDKDNVISYKEKYDINLNKIKEIFLLNESRILQSSRVKKYIYRNSYLDAYMKYIKEIAEPLVIISRLIYTPRHYEYVLCHLNNHLPKEIVLELEPFFKVSSFDDISLKILDAQKLLQKYKKALYEKYNLYNITD